MKLFVTILAYVIAITMACDDSLTTDDLRLLKCNNDIAFRGLIIRGSSSQFNDGPYRFNFRRDVLNVTQAYRGNIGTGELTVFGVFPADGACSSNPFGGSDSLVFARMNSTYNMYQVYPCSINPASSCVDLAAFNDILC